MSPRNFLVVGAVALLAACGQKADQPVQQPDANPAATIPTPANEAAAPDFVEKAAISDMFEVESSKVALTRSNNSEVKRFAQMMIDAHTKSTNDLKAAIAASGLAITPPAALPADKQAAVDNLKTIAPAEFDLKYMNDQVDGHDAALNLMQRQANDGDTPQIKAFATATAPAVQMHYDAAKALRDRLRDGPATPAAK